MTMFLLAGLAGPAAHSQRRASPPLPATGSTVAYFIPPRYGELADSRAVGDLNHDGRPDLALVLRPLVEDTTAYPDEALPARLLLVLFGTPTGYVLAAQTGRAVLCKGCGGMYGDPFAGLTIEKGILGVAHYGGSNWRWRIDSKFRYQQNGFYLIGETRDYGRNDGDCPGLVGPAGWEYRDTNFLTGDYEVWKVSEECQLLAHRRGKNKPAPLRKLGSSRVNQ